MAENSLNHSREIIKKIEDIMKCEICSLKYDYNIHKPMIIKCGHTFCKFCIYNLKEKNEINIEYKQNKSFKCPIDGTQHSFNYEKNSSLNEPTIYPNLKLENILKEILNISEPKIKEKYIIYSKPDMKRNKSPENSNKNTINYNSEGNLIDNNKIKDKKNSEDSNYKKNKNINIKINSGNQIINVNAINVNIDTREILKKEEKNKINDDIKDININSNNNDSMLNDDLNTLHINEEMNVNDGKLNFENEKINDDSIETIPLNEEKSMTNMSFRDDFKELLNKNDEFKYQISGNLKTDENNNEIITNTGMKKKAINSFNNINNNNLKQTMKAYNKKNLVYESNSNNKYNNSIKLTEPSRDDSYNKGIIDETKKINNVHKNNNPEKLSVYRNKKIKDLNSNGNKENHNDYLNGPKGINANKSETNEKKKIYDNNTNRIKENELNFNKLNKNEIKDIFRKTNYYELSKNNMINNMNNNNNKINMNNKVLNKQDNIISSNQLKKDNENCKLISKASPSKNEIKQQILNVSGIEMEKNNKKKK